MRSPYLRFSLLPGDCGQGPDFACSACFPTRKSGKETHRFRVYPLLKVQHAGCASSASVPRFAELWNSKWTFSNRRFTLQTVSASAS